jgi:predicted nucleotidyltransferase
MTPKLIDQLKQILELKLLYLFGSQANGTANPHSDYDFAVYLETTDQNKLGQLKIQLIGILIDAYNHNQIDLVILNEDISPELKYNAIQFGQIIYEIEPYRVLIEPLTLNDYFDYRETLIRNNLTKSKIISST